MSDSTGAQFDDTQVDYVPADDTGYPEKCAKQDTIENFAAMEGVVDFPDHLWIEPKDWKDVARMNDTYGTWAEDYRNRFTNQTPTHECTCHCLIQVAETSWNRQNASKENAVYFSALGVYAEANPRVRGGSTMQRTLGIAYRRGFIPDHEGPGGRTEQKDKYPHTLHCTAGSSDYSTNGPWVSVDRFPDGWQTTAKLFRPLKYINIRTWEQTVCCLLNGYAVGVGRWGHAIPYQKIVWRGDAIHAQYSDSYVVNRFDSIKGIKDSVGGAYAILSMTSEDAA